MDELRIKELCKQKGVKVGWVIEQAGYSQPSSFYDALRKEGLDIRRLRRIAKALDVEVADLFVRNGESIVCPVCGAKLKIEVKED